jgi:hypothetical protein
LSSAPAAPTELGDHHMESIYHKYHILKEFLKNGEKVHVACNVIGLNRRQTDKSFGPKYQCPFVSQASSR